MIIVRGIPEQNFDGFKNLSDFFSFSFFLILVLYLRKRNR